MPWYLSGLMNQTTKDPRNSIFRIAYWIVYLIIFFYIFFESLDYRVSFAYHTDQRSIEIHSWPFHNHLWGLGFVDPLARQRGCLSLQFHQRLPHTGTPAPTWTWTRQSGEGDNRAYKYNDHDETCRLSHFKWGRAHFHSFFIYNLSAHSQDSELQ